MRINRGIWQSLAALWAFGGLLAWLSSFAVLSAPIAGSSVTLLACMLVAIGVGLKWVWLSTSVEASAQARSSFWLLCTIGNVNWFGFLVAAGSNLAEAAPVVILFVLAEFLTWKASNLSWLNQWKESELSVSRPDGMQSLVTSFSSSSEGTAESSVADANRVEDQPVDAPTAVADFKEDGYASCETSLAGEGIVRRCVEGIDGVGRRFLSGTIFITMPPRQKTEEVVVGFCPAFNGAPEVEFEVDHEQVIARLVACTPAGMRVLLRRSGAADQLKFAFEWFATQPAEQLDGSGLHRSEKLRVLP